MCAAQSSLDLDKKQQAQPENQQIQQEQQVPRHQASAAASQSSNSNLTAPVATASQGMQTMTTASISDNTVREQLPASLQIMGKKRRGAQKKKIAVTYATDLCLIHVRNLTDFCLTWV